jgi:UDPglucose 6-dehydrogenase
VGESLRFLREVDAVNRSRRRLAVSAARELAGGSFAGRNAAALGAAFKPGTEDVRDSPALSVADAIRREGATVTVHDPRASYNARRVCPDLAFAEEPAKPCEAADVVLHLT